MFENSLTIIDGPPPTSAAGGIVDPRQLENTYVLEEGDTDPGYIIGAKPGVSHTEAKYSIC